MPKKRKKRIISRRKNDLTKSLILYGFVLLIGGLIVYSTFNPLQEAREEKSLSEVVSLIKQERVEKIEIQDDFLNIFTKDGEEYLSRKEVGTSVVEVLQREGIDPTTVAVVVKGPPASARWLGFLVDFLPIFLMVAFFFFIFRGARAAGGSVFSFGQSKAKLFVDGKESQITFKDVAGVDEAKRELEEVVEFLKRPAKFRKLGARIPRGVLLVGPSGVGKTLLARALAGEAGVPFYSMAGSEFMEMLVGVGASRVRDLFSTAKKNAPSIIFIDELESIGHHRSASMVGGHGEREQTLNQILVEMDGFTPNENVIVLAATNRPDLLDFALVRPGRFDRRVVLDMPDISGREAIVKIHMQGKPFMAEVSVRAMAKKTVGFSGADLENMLNEAAILAALGGRKKISNQDVDEAALKVKMGPEKKRLQSKGEKEMVAYHEAGHALTASQLKHIDPVERVSIISRGLTLGFTSMLPQSDRYNETRTRLLEIIAVALGGRVAEELVFNELTTGAASDFANATQLARKMVQQFGMSTLGPGVAPLPLDMQPAWSLMGGGQTYSQETLAKIDQEVRRIVDEQYEVAKDILGRNREKLDRVAAALVERESLTGEEFRTLLKGSSGPRSEIQSGD